jgi:hypothetical protein
MKLLTLINLVVVTLVGLVLYDIIRNPPEIEITMTIEPPKKDSDNIGFVNYHSFNGGSA